MCNSVDKILVTGANGFIGRRLRLGCRALVRKRQESTDIVGDLLDIASLRASCEGIDTVYHCAGYAHAFGRSNPDDHWRINFEGTRNLVRAAGESGVKRLVFLSSVKAMATPGQQCVTEAFEGRPTTAYGQSKWAAEQAVLEGGAKYGMHVVNLRLAMTYGFGGNGNLDRMARGIRAGWFPPIPETHNRRSLVHVSDVISAIKLSAQNPRAAGATYIVSDPQQYSGKQIYDAICDTIGVAPRSWAVPAALLRNLGFAGDFVEKRLKVRSPIKSELSARLLDSECYLPTTIEQSLGWRAQINLKQGLLEMVGK